MILLKNKFMFTLTICYLPLIKILSTVDKKKKSFFYILDKLKYTEIAKHKLKTIHFRSILSEMLSSSPTGTV